MDEQSATLSIGEVAARTGLSVHALRYYEREGILAQPVRRAAGGRRLYTEDDVDWLFICTILRGAGMPLPDIRRYTELVLAGAGNEAGRLELLRRHEERIAAQRTQLDRCHDLIRFKIGVYEDILGATDGGSCGSAGPERADTAVGQELDLLDQLGRAVDDGEADADRGDHPAQRPG